MIENFDKQLFRCSSLGNLLTNPRSKSELLSVTAQSELIKIFNKEYYGREDNVETKYMEKGLLCEEDSLSLLSKFIGTFLKKNETRFNNEYITGLPDVTKPKGYEIKTSWSLATFSKAKSDDYIEQCQGYMFLTDSDHWHLAYCLVNNPPHQIMEAQKKLHYKLPFDESSEEYEQAMNELERSMTFDDIPYYERVKMFRIERDEEMIEKIKERVELWRDFLNGMLAERLELKIKYANK